jgi:hypothetical protein
LEKHRRNDLAAYAEAVGEAKRKSKSIRKTRHWKAREIEKISWVETDFEVDGMTVAAIKLLQLEKYRSYIWDIPKKSELNKMKNLVLLLFSTLSLLNIQAYFILYKCKLDNLLLTLLHHQLLVMITTYPLKSN